MNPYMSKYKGVFRTYESLKTDRQWIAQIFIAGKRRIIGAFATEEEAAKAYDKIAKVLFEDEAELNFTEDECIK